MVEPEAKVAAERRQLTVLFCDIVGFSELSNRVDPEVLHQIIRSFADACVACVVRYDGYVFQRLVDGIVAFFGYPLAHEGEAERAIHAGLEIIAALSTLHVPEVEHLAVRVGIASGLVVVSSSEKGAVGETMKHRPEHRRRHARREGSATGVLPVRGLDPLRGLPQRCDKNHHGPEGGLPQGGRAHRHRQLTAAIVGTRLPGNGRAAHAAPTITTANIPSALALPISTSNAAAMSSKSMFMAGSLWGVALSRTIRDHLPPV